MTGKNTVWLLSHSYLPAMGGIENYLREAAKFLLERGRQPVVICRNRPGLADEEVIAGVRVIRHPDFPVPRKNIFSRHLYLTERIAAWLRESPYCRGGWALARYPHYGAALASLPHRCPSLYLPASVWPALTALGAAGGSCKTRFFARLAGRQVANLERRALAGADRLVVFSRNLARQLQSYYGVDPQRISLNPPGVDRDRFRPRRPDAQLLRSLNLPPQQPRILFIGRLSPEKNLFFLLRSLEPLLRDSRSSLLLAGDGPDRPGLEKEIQRRGLEASVRLLSPPEKPEDLYPLGDIFVSPSRYESFGQTILEAMASGRPVVALKTSPPRILTAAEEIIEEDGSGVTVAEDPVQFRNAVAALLAAPARRSQMGQRGREICQMRFSWENHINSLLKTIDQSDPNNAQRP